MKKSGKKYTVGFIFDKDMKKVLLVHKTAPEWQVGLINGVGGKLEIGETTAECIVREIKEETNIDVSIKDVVDLGGILGEDQAAEVEVFGVVYQGELFEAFIFEKEKIEWFPVDQIPGNVIPNLKWLIPLTLEKLKYGKIIRFNINYKSF